MKFDPSDSFIQRHIGPTDADVQTMLRAIGADSVDDLVKSTVPAAILAEKPLALPAPRSEADVLAELREMAERNVVARSYLGLGYADTITPPVILRNLIESPGWYTQYTPYQAEISQGRLEMLLNFQTMVADLTGMQIANASLLDEATAAAEAMSMSHAAVEKKNKSETFFVARNCHPQTVAVVQTRAKAVGFGVVVGDPFEFDFAQTPVFGALLQYPDTEGAIHDYRAVVERVHTANALVTVATDLLALALLVPPGEWGADIVVGNSQRFGVPLGFGGPHAAFFATKEEFKRLMPGRIIGVSKDANGNRALRMALQTREQHIRREKATSNICTAQVLLANVAAAYAVYHGPDGLRDIAGRVHRTTTMLAAGLKQLGCTIAHETVFDTLKVALPAAAAVERLHEECSRRRINLRHFSDGTFGVALDETVTEADLGDLFAVFAAATGGISDTLSLDQLAQTASASSAAAPFARQSTFLSHPVFHSYRSETEMMRYLHRLASRDLSLNTSMIPLGSCTMKLNAAAEMMALSWPGFNRVHPFAPPSQTAGYNQLINKLGTALMEITGFAGVSFMPNSGAQGEYAGMLVIRAYHDSRGDSHRNVCLIPKSAHGTNPATAVMAGMKVVVVACDAQGNIDVADLRAKADAHGANLAALMVTYPSTHGVFEEAIREICDVVHAAGGQVYMDGANMNAQVGICRPADFGADVCHLNLHKTFCIPHGGGGPGMGPIAVAPHLVPFLPTHPLVETGGGETGIGPVSAAPFGSPLILTISWAYMAMMGAEGLKRATEIAILNANYMASRVARAFLPTTKKPSPGGSGAGRETAILFANRRKRVAHEFILDLNPFDATADISAEDVAKRLMDYGYHAPTLSFPVAGTLMIEPTESESKAELDRFCDALLAIREEIRQIETGDADRADNVLKNAPHPALTVTADEWAHPYSRHQAAFPAPWTREHKFWPAVARVDNVYGDRNLICSCPPIEEYATSATT